LAVAAENRVRSKITSDKSALTDVAGFRLKIRTKDAKSTKNYKGNKLRSSLKISRLCSSVTDAFPFGEDAFGKKG
jgi:hypothetical protein